MLQRTCSLVSRGDVALDGSAHGPHRNAQLCAHGDLRAGLECVDCALRAQDQHHWQRQTQRQTQTQQAIA